MKEKKKKEQKELKKVTSKSIKKSAKGITLIALVITIIVLLILATVSIATLTGQNGILTRANDAKEQTEIGEEKEAIGLAYNGAMAKNSGTGVSYQDLNDQFELNGRTDAHADGDNPIIVTFDSGRSYTVDSNGNISGPEEANIIATMKIVGEKVTTDPSMPNDNFEHVAGTDINNGYVIKDKTNGNEFVWVPVDKNQKIEVSVTSKEEIASITLTDPYGDEILTESNKGTSYSNKEIEPSINGIYKLVIKSGEETKQVELNVKSLYAQRMWELDMLTEEIAKAKGYADLDAFIQDFFGMEAGTDVEDVKNMIISSYKGGMFVDKEDYASSVNTNGGFYIGRYEASYEGGNAVSKVSTVANTSSSVSDGKLWNWVSQEEALQKSKEMYLGKSSLLTGAAWDRTLGWLEETGAVSSLEILGDSATWGNYNDDEFSNTEDLINTGSISQTEKNHIFDLAGNLREWTTEANGTDDRVYRGR